MRHFQPAVLEGADRHIQQLAIEEAVKLPGQTDQSKGLKVCLLALHSC